MVQYIHQIHQRILDLMSAQLFHAAVKPTNSLAITAPRSVYKLTVCCGGWTPDKFQPPPRAYYMFTPREMIKPVSAASSFFRNKNAQA